MGNQLAPPAKLQADHVAELPNVVFKDTLGGGRFLKTLLCVHDDGGSVVVKAYYKRGESPSLEPYKQQLLAIKARLVGIDCPHVWPVQQCVETSSAGFMLRRHFFANLYDRLSTRPFLSDVEKRWIMFQLLHAVMQCHERGVCHGDIKCENVLVTSWNWVFITDLAPYKPTYLPADNPADFSFFFDNGGRRRCYLAPERFYEGSAAAVNPNTPLRPEMDIFSLGCVISELFSDGKATFDLAQLLAFRCGQYNPLPRLEGLAPDVREMVAHMLQLEPGARLTAREYLYRWPAPLFPAYFEESLHPFFNNVLRLNTDARVAALHSCFDQLEERVMRPDRKRVSTSGVLTIPASSLTSLTLKYEAIPKAATGPAALQKPGSQVPASSSSSSSAAAPAPASAASQELLADVSTLLADVSGLQQQLAEGGRAAAGAGGEMDAGLLLDEWEAGSHPHASSGSSGAAAAAASAPPGGLAVDEVVTEEVYEYNIRELGSWMQESSEAAGIAAGGGRRRQDVALPPGGWLWTGDWHVEVRPGATDTQGWQYRQTLQEGAAAGPAGAPWSERCSEGSSMRRRKWLRQRRRKPAPDASGATRTCAGSAAGTELASGTAGVAVPGQPGEGMVLITVLLCTLLRGSKLQESKLRAIAMLARAALLCHDDVRLQIAAPHLLALITQSEAKRGKAAGRAAEKLPAGVRALALRCLVRLVASVSAIPPSDAKVFHDWLLPSLSALPHDDEEAVRVEYAHGVAALAGSAHRHLLRMQHDSNAAGSGARGLPRGPPIRFDVELGVVRGLVERLVLELVTGVRTTAEIKRALLGHARPLAEFFGRRDLNDLLLPLLITCLNAGEWQLRAAFFEAVASIGAYTGKESLDVFLLPCLEQALMDSETAVITDAVRCISAVCNHLHKRSLLKAASKVAPLLRHHSTAVRSSAVAFMAAAAAVLPPADVYTQLHALLEGALEGALAPEPLLLSDQAQLARCLQLRGRPAAGAAAGLADSAGQQEAPSPSVLGLGVPYAAAPLPAAEAEAEQAAADAEAEVQGDHDAYGGLPQSPLSFTPPHPADSIQPDPSLPNLKRHLGVHPEGDSELVLRPQAPVYTIDINPSATYQTSLSAHQAALQSIQSRQHALEQRLAVLKDKAAREPASLDASDKQQLERLASTLACLGTKAGADVRDESTLMTFKLTQLAGRISSQQGPGQELPGGALRVSGLSVQGQAQGSPGPGSPSASGHVTDAVAAAISTGIVHPSSPTGHHTFKVIAGPAWRPRGVLAAHLTEHRAAVNKLAVARGGAFFASASSDETVKVWDLRRLEKDVSFHSRLTYAAQGGAIMSLAACEDDQSVASGSSAGSIHIWRVEYTTRQGGGAPDKYTGVVSKRQVACSEGAILQIQQWGNLLLYVTQKGGTHAWDLRTQRDAFVLPCLPSQGLLEQLVADPTGSNWLLTGGSRGFLDLWDVRFQLRVNCWQHPTQCGIDALAPAACSPPKLGLRSMELGDGRPLVYVAAGQNEVGIWDLLECRCHQVLRVLSKEEARGMSAYDLPASLQQPPHRGTAAPAPSVRQAGQAAALARSLALDQLQVPSPRTSGIRALLPMASGALMTAGTDRCLRYWEGSWPEHSYVVCGPIWPDSSCVTDAATGVLQLPRDMFRCTQRYVNDVPVIEEQSSGEPPVPLTDASDELRTKMKLSDLCHADAVTDLLLAEAGSSRVLLSCSRDGCIKAWK